MIRSALAILLTASACRAQVATLLVRLDDAGRIIGRRASTDRYAKLKHEGWVKAMRPPGVCIRRALYNHRPAWVEWTPVGPVAWDSIGAAKYLNRYGHRGPVPPPEETP